MTNPVLTLTVFRPQAPSEPKILHIIECIIYVFLYSSKSLLFHDTATLMWCGLTTQDHGLHKAFINTV